MIDELGVVDVENQTGSRGKCRPWLSIFVHNHHHIGIKQFDKLETQNIMVVVNPILSYAYNEEARNAKPRFVH